MSADRAGAGEEVGEDAGGFGLRGGEAGRERQLVGPVLPKLPRSDK
ncbi:hypothetical protein [Streptomyces pratensis]